jgi:hypothetical protein
VKRFHIEGKFPDRKVHGCLFPKNLLKPYLQKSTRHSVRFHKEEQLNHQFISDKSIYTRNVLL